jgi:hypothetical protein
MSDLQYTPPPPPEPPQVPPPPPPPPPTEAPATQFDFGRPFTFVFDDPQWLPKILIGGLFYLAGFLLVGWPFILGYAARLARNVVAGVARPLPEWDDLGGFFSEGLRMVAVALVYIIPFVMIAVMVMIPTAILDSMDNDALSAIAGIVGGCFSCLLVPLSLLLIIFMPASLLFAAVEQRFNAAFEFARIWPFIRENIGNYLLAVVVYLIARFLGGFGVMLLCVGVIFTGFWSILITTHAFAQVYRLASKR